MVENAQPDLTAPNYAVELANLGATGKVNYGPKGADIKPLANMGAYVAPFVDLGWLSDGGLTEALSEEVNDFVPWQSTSSIRTATASREFSFTFVLWSLSGLANALYYGVAEDEMKFDDGTKVTTFEQGGELPDTARFVMTFDIVDGDKARRFILPNASVQERGDITYTKTEMVGYELTVRANVDPALGYSIQRQFLEGWQPGKAGSILTADASAGSLGEWHEPVAGAAPGGGGERSPVSA